jgi:hypothetical protein
MAIDPTIWGPHYWFFLHTVAFCYPLFPSTVTKKKYYNLVHNFPLFIPTEKIGNEFSKLLDKYPVTPYLDNRDSFLKWTHFIHNKINKKLNKPIISFTKFINEYKNYKIKKNKREYKHMIKQMILIILIFILACLIYYSIIIYEKRR